MNRQKARDAALLLPLLGLMLLMPPFVGLLRGAAGALGVPALVVYVFVVWAALIATGMLLSRRLRGEMPPDRHQDGGRDADR